jgi:hypothetical protein
MAALATTAITAFANGTGGVQVSLAPLDLVNVTRETLGLTPLAGLALASFSAFWLAASVGLRWIGLGAAWRALREGSAAGAALAVLALSGWPLGLLFKETAQLAARGFEGTPFCF